MYFYYYNWEEYMEIEFRFTEGDKSISPLSIAQILCDIQHLNSVIYGITCIKNGSIFAHNMMDLLINESCYSYQAYAQNTLDLGLAEIELTSINKNSPLNIKGILKRLGGQADKDIPTLYKSVLKWLTAKGDRAEQEACLTEQEVINKKLQNAKELLDLTDGRISAEDQEKLLKNVLTSLDSFDRHDMKLDTIELRNIRIQPDK